jgi:mannose-6-phosphate isomerase-like protein (cupin superfamily)
MSKLTTGSALQALKDSKSDFVRLLERDGFDVGLYKPEKVDRQTPHLRDELYVVANGSGFFQNGGETEAVQAGDVLFVAAGAEHRFTDFSDDFAAWVIFIGPRPKPA